MKIKKRFGWIGFGNFGRFALPYLSSSLDVWVYDRVDKRADVEELGLNWGTLEEVASCDLLVLAVPVQFLENLLIDIKDLVKPRAMVFDVSSVKVKPINLMKKYLPATTEIIGTHPLFGPQSGKNGVEGLNLVLCPVRTRKHLVLSRFFTNHYKLNVLERTPDVHDRQMAYVQALTHFIGRACNEMDIPDVEQKTPAYQYLLNIKRNLGQDSMDLFLTIELENPYAKDVRLQLLEELHALNDRLDDLSKK
ncbi:MAG: pdh [Chitinophagaceae bacterium]|nr:pdh [Chitinophagaceae bacterium]